MIQTSAGLPNSCSQCGKRIVNGMWWAEHVDAARTGSGVCDDCHAPKSPPQTIAPHANDAMPKQTDAPQLEPRKQKGKAK